MLLNASLLGVVKPYRLANMGVGHDMGMAIVCQRLHALCLLLSIL